MRAQLALVGALGLAAGLLGVSPVQAQVQQPGRISVNALGGARLNHLPPPNHGICHTTRVRIFHNRNPYAYNPYMAYPSTMLPYQQQYLPAYVPPQTPTPESPGAQTSSSSYSQQAKLTPSNGEQRKAPEAPAEPAVRMRYVELTVKGVQNAADGDKLTLALDKMKGSRGASVKRKDNGEATVKVWYSDKDPLESADVAEAVKKLGFTAVPTSS